MNVKVCNLRDNSFGSDFRKSVMDTGFAVVTHHGIDKTFIRDTQDAWREFFLSDLSRKVDFIDQVDSNLGYKGFKSEKAVGAKKADLKEFFHYKPGGKLPAEVSSLNAIMFERLNDIGIQILRDLEWNKCCENSDNTILRTLYYPAMDFAAEPGSVRAAAHEDINFITLLVAASAAGLQVLDTKGKWHDVPHEENSIVVNIGDMLQLASRGIYKSTTHRVVNPTDSKSDRISMPLFVHPHSDTLLSDGFTAGEFLAQRIAEIYQKTK
jgi:isopenicillin N synthase-like dioxygenase